MLPLFDLVIASDKATFCTPYGKLGQIAEGAAVFTLSHILGSAIVSFKQKFFFGLQTRKKERRITRIYISIDERTSFGWKDLNGERSIKGWSRYSSFMA